MDLVFERVRKLVAGKQHVRVSVQLPEQTTRQHVEEEHICTYMFMRLWTEADTGKNSASEALLEETSGSDERAIVVVHLACFITEVIHGR